MMGAMLGRKFFGSILGRLLMLGVSLVVVALVGRYFVFSRFLREDMTKVVAEQQLALASYAARDIDHSIAKRQAQLKKLAALIPARALSDPAEMDRWMVSTLAVQTLFSGGLAVTDFKGRLRHAHSSLSAGEAARLLDENALRALRQDGIYIGHPLTAGRQAEPVLPIMTPVRSAQGGEVAVLVGLTRLSDPDFLGNLMHGHIGKSTGGFLLISPQDQLFVAASQPDMVLKPTPPAGVNQLHDKAMAGYRGTGVTMNARGVEEISAMVTVPSTGWFVVARIPTSEALVTVDHARTFMLRNAYFSMAVFLTIFVAALYVLLRPLMRATAQAEKMTLGLAPMQALPVHSNDEVGTLIGAFNRLLGKLNEQNAVLTNAAHHDALTGLPNRVLLADRLSQALAQATRHQTGVALLFLDLDMFKPINDSLGHEAGDKVLQEVARRLKTIVRDTDSVARVGGDEFVVLLSEVADPALAAAQRVAQEIITALREPIVVGDTQCTVGVSIGGTIGTARSLPESLLLRADHLMYKAKSLGRGRYVIEDGTDPPASR